MYQNQYDSLFTFKSKEGTVTENVVEHRKKNNSFNPNHEVKDETYQQRFQSESLFESFWE